MKPPKPGPSSAITGQSTVKSARRRSPAGRRARRCCARVPTARRFEVPNAFRRLDRLLVRYARWDLSRVHLVDEHTGLPCARLYPLDKGANANGIRRPLEPVATRAAERADAAVTPATGIAPLLDNLMAQQRATGLPPPYLPKDELPDTENEGENS